MTDTVKKPLDPRRYPEQRARLVRLGIFAAFVFLLGASWAYELERRFMRPLPKLERPTVAVPGFDARGGSNALITIAYDDHKPSNNSPDKLPILLLHGSPGHGSELGRIAAPLQAAGYRVITPDLPGFGDSTHNPPSLSIFAHAHEVLALMDQLHIQKAHIVGWSLGGGVAMHMADLTPDRVASLTLMASISDQESEGTRSYFAEHAKYALGYAAATAARYAIPHFGYLSHLDDIRASMINFWDTDMRPLQGVMRRMTTPTLILHGTSDPLVPRWAAEHSHELINPSTLVMTPYSHFFPFMQPGYAAAAMLPFIARHDVPGPPLRQVVNLAPERPSLLGAPGDWATLELRRAHWTILLLVGALLALYRLRTAAVLLFTAAYFGLIDNGIAIGSLLIAQLIASLASIIQGRKQVYSIAHSRVFGSGISTRTISHWQQVLIQHPILAALASRFIPGEHGSAFGVLSLGRSATSRRLYSSFLFILSALFSWLVWTLFYLIVSILVAIFLIQPLIDHLKLPGLLLGLVIAVSLIRSFELLFTTTGRRLLRIGFTRITRREYWPSHLLYYPTAPYFIYLGLKHAPIAFTACNPGIEHGGGLIGESKQSILDAMPDAAPWILQSLRVGDGDPEQRTARVLDAIEHNPALSYPVILKPDSGYRGHAVKLAQSASDIRAYFQSMLAPAILQRYHAGPQECGILWARNPRNPKGPGFIFSVTRKEFPVLTGDGRHTFEQLIFRHKRFHAQAGVFLSRHADQRTRILAKGETFRLAESGNHCQGTLFLDGEDLITPDLTAAIDSIAQGFRGGLDIGRFDIRYESDELLRQGEGFAIIELNGITGESTNIYDPGRSIWWAYKTHFRQWRLMYELGMTRMAQGHKPMSVKEVFARIRAHRHNRSGPSLAD